MRVRRGPSSVLAANIAARVGALISLAVGTFVVARAGGPTAVGVYALLRVLPGLMGVAISSGLPGAIAYFLAGPDRNDRRLPLTLLSMALAGGAAGSALWVAGSPLVGGRLFPDLPLGLLIWAGATVLTQLIVATAKSCSQGSDDLPGANRVIFNEEFMFLPAYGVLWFSGIHGYVALVAGLLIADVVTFSLAWQRLIGRGFFRSATRPSPALARQVASYGLRAQVGGIVSLLNLRFDFIILNLISGSAVLGVYAIASKFAELLKIPALALTYVLYPRFARDGRVRAAVHARRLIPKAAVLTAGGAVPLWFAAPYVIPLLYGSAFKSAITPAQIILLGLAIEGAAGVITAFLYGGGHPGLNSLAMGAGLVATLALDFLLIPPFGAIGAATASAVAYLVSTVALGWFFWRAQRSLPAVGDDDEQLHAASPAAAAVTEAAPPPAATSPPKPSFFVFAPTPSGYQFLECPGKLPAVGDTLEVPGCSETLVVTRVGASPLPDNNRPCAYLELALDPPVDDRKPAAVRLVTE